jgi:hypothetical protein
VVLPEGFT